jgi:hypothetical protein
MMKSKLKVPPLGATRRRFRFGGHAAAFAGIVMVMLAIVVAGWCDTGTASAAVSLPQLLTQFPSDKQAGSSAGRFAYPQGVAVNPINGDIYLDDTSNLRIDEFTPWGGFVRAWGWGVADGTSDELQTCTTTCFSGIPGHGVGQMDYESDVAVDGAGNVYVAGRTDYRVQKFSSSGEFILMFGGEVDKTTKANICTKADIERGDECGVGTVGVANGQFGVRPDTSPAFLASGPGDIVYVGDEGRVQEFEPDGTYRGDFPDPEDIIAGKTVRALAVDSSGDLYVSFAGETLSQIAPNVQKLSPTGTLIGSLAVDRPERLATDSAGDVYVLAKAIYESKIDPMDEIREFGPGGEPLIPIGSEFATPLGGLPLTGLAVNSVGDIVVTAAYDDFGENYASIYGPPPVALEPPPAIAPTIVAEYASSVEPEGAVVRAQINPNFWPVATYYLQYGRKDCAEGGCVDLPVAPGSMLTGASINAAVTTEDINLTGLQPDTVYHYRFVSQSGGGGPVYGSDRTFTTFPRLAVPDQDCPNREFRVGASALLADCRAFEMVSPVDKNGGDAKALASAEGGGTPASLDVSASTGGKLTYSAYRAFGDAQSAPYSVQYIATRTEGEGWSNHAISPPRDLSQFVGVPSTYADTPFKAFSPDLSQAWLLQDTGPLLAPGAVSGFVNLYRRENLTESYEALTTVRPPHVTDPGTYIPELQGVSSDGTRAVFRVDDNLTPEAVAELPQVYEAVGGKLHLVSILPNGTPSKEVSSAGADGFSAEGDRESTVEHAMSENGSRIFWTAEHRGIGKIYVRENPDQEQSAIEEGECVEPAKACTIPVSQSVSASPARFWLASADGSTALFTFAEGPHAGDLYEFNVDTRQATLIAHEVVGVVGASEDTSYVYFVSDDAIAGGATEGEPNLYLYHGGATSFIATLGSRADGFITSPEPDRHRARVTPDGRHLVFVSNASPTGGYDNLDVNSGEADLEVYRYDADSGQLNCVSCNRTGARPGGSDAEGAWVAAWVPSWQNQLYQSRYVSDDGDRVFFDSFDALLPQDNNGKEDVYEWEAPGTGECSEQAASYSPPNGGCLSLISTGESPQDTEFVDASANGDEVFITTDSSLVAKDPGLYDIYDARVDGGFPERLTRAECEGEACQSPPGLPVDTTPGSFTFTGNGNLVASLANKAVAPRSKSLTRAQKLARALKACQSKPRKKRAVCRALARKRYGPKARRSRSTRRPVNKTARGGR